MRRTVPVLLVLLTALPQAALAGEWFRCRYDGETRATCCCVEGAHQESGVARAELRRTPCCDVLRNEPGAMSARAEPRGDGHVTDGTAQAAAVPASMGVLDAATDVSWAPPPRAMAPPGLGRPLYLSHSSLLL